MLLPLWAANQSLVAELNDVVLVDSILGVEAGQLFYLSASQINSDYRTFVNLIRAPALVEIYDRESREFVRRTVSNQVGYWKITGLSDKLYNVHGLSISGDYEDDFIGGVEPIADPPLGQGE